MKGQLALALLCAAVFCDSLTYADNNSTTMPLTYFRNSGLADAWKSDEAFITQFEQDYNQEWNRDTKTYALNTGDSDIDVVGSTSFEQIERSELGATVNHAGCDLYDQVVEIPNDKANVLMYPSCVQLKQCGGCCGHPSLACKPTATKKKSIQIMKYTYDGTSAHPVQKVDYVQLEEHTACECQCKVTEEECNPALHVFDSWDCKCACKNAQEQCANNKRWDENICGCRCANVQTCGSGYEFNMNTCSCQEISERSGGGSVSPNEPTNEVETTPETDQCAHMKCPRRYKAVVGNGGSCFCDFDREAALRG